MSFKAKKLQQFEEIEIPESGSNHNDTQNSINQHHEEDEERFTLDILPRRVIAITIMLTCLGIVFLIVGLALFFSSSKNFKQYISLLILGVLMLIPGIFYSCKLYQFTRAQTVQEQRQIMNDFPLD